jgi:Pyruvate/2-oxoacid:ferredoxin oxidoreductase gamma subunit
LRSVIAAIRQKFPTSVAEKNVAAATEAFELVLKTKDAIHA